MVLKKRIDIHDFDRSVELSFLRLKNHTQVSEPNKKTILKFVDNCIAEGLSKARIVFYLFHLTKIGAWCTKNFDVMSKDDVKDVVRAINSGDFSDSTMKDFCVVLKRFFKFVKGIEDKGVYPDEVRWISPKLKNGNHKLPEDLLTQEEVQSMIDAAEHPRDKALIATLYETGCRIGELASLRIKNVSFDKYGAVIVVTGKTGMRRVRIISYVSYLSSWLNIHPDRGNPDAPLWVVIGTTKGIAKKKIKGYQFNWSYELKYRTLSKILERAAKKAGLKKRHNPHLFRHSRATKLANVLTEAQLKELFGWTQSSSMASIYVHMSGRDVDDALLKLHGLKEKTAEDDQQKPTRCPRCSEINPPNFKFCGKCAMALDLKAVMEKEDKMKAALSFMDESIDEKDLDRKLEEWVNKKVEVAIREKLKKLDLHS